MLTFTYMPDWSAAVEMAPRVTRVSFGDGYEARTTDGLNTKLKKWNCQFKRFQEEALAIYDFFNTSGGVVCFEWTDPDGYTSSWICDSWTRTYDNIGWGTVSATLREVPEAAV